MPGLDWAVFIIDPAANLQWSSGTKADNSRRQQAATLGRDEIMLQRGRISNVVSILSVIPAVRRENRTAGKVLDEICKYSSGSMVVTSRSNPAVAVVASSELLPRNTIRRRDHHPPQTSSTSWLGEVP